MLLCPHRFQWGGGAKGSPLSVLSVCMSHPIQYKDFFSYTMAQGREQLCHIDISIFIISEEANILLWLIRRLSMSSVVTMGKQTYCGGL